MKKIFIGCFMVAVAFISLCVYGVDSNTLHYDDGEFSFDYPANMTVISNSNVFFLDTIASNPQFKSKYVAEMFFVQSESPLITFAAYKTSSEPGIGLNEIISTFHNNINSDPSIDFAPDERNITLNGVSAYQISAGGEREVGNNNEYYEKVVIFENKGMIYILYFSINDFSITAGDRSLFDSYSNKILQNLQVK